MVFTIEQKVKCCAWAIAFDYLESPCDISDINFVDPPTKKKKIIFKVEVFIVRKKTAELLLQEKKIWRVCFYTAISK